MTDYSDLIERVGKAEGPDREIDLELMMIGYGGPREQYLTDELGRVAFGHQHKFTASLDAALSLVEQMLPGALWRVEKQGPVALSIYAPEFRHLYGYWATCGLAGEQTDATGATPALAVIAALLRALEEKGKA